jgi:hypothetical protein
VPEFAKHASQDPADGPELTVYGRLSGFNICIKKVHMLVEQTPNFAYDECDNFLVIFKIGEFCEKIFAFIGHDLNIWPGSGQRR